MPRFTLRLGTKYLNHWLEDRNNAFVDVIDERGILTGQLIRITGVIYLPFSLIGAFSMAKAHEPECLSLATAAMYLARCYPNFTGSDYVQVVFFVEA